MNLSQQTIRAGSWQLAAVASKVVLQLLVLAVLARYVSPKEFGYIAIANMVMVFIEMLAEAGIGPAIVQKKDLTGEHIKAGFTLSVGFGILFVSLLWISAPFISRFFQSENLVSIIRYFGLSLLITKLSLVSRSRIEREMRFDTLMKVDVFSYLFGYALAGIVMAVMGYGVWAIVVGKLVQCCLQTASLLVKRPVSIIPAYSISAYKDLLTYGGGLTLVRIFDSIASQGDYFIIGRFLGSSSLGLYERASSIMGMPGQYLSSVLDKSLFPAMSQVQEESKRLENAFFTASIIVSTFLIPVSVLMIFVAPEIIAVLLGPNWSESILPFQILSVTVVFRIFINISDTLVRATGAVYPSAVRRGIFAFLIIVFSWIGQFGGLIHVAVAINIAVFIGYLLMLHLSVKIIQFKMSDYLKIVLNGFIIGSILLVVIFPLVTVLRMFMTQKIVILAITVACSCLLTVSVLVLFPRLMGRLGVEFIGNVIQILPRKNKTIHDFLEMRGKAQ